MINRQIRLASRPAGFPEPSNFRLESDTVREPPTGQFLVRVIYLSVDPYMRGRMNDAPSYAPPVAIGEVMEGGGVGLVEQSQHDKFRPGDVVVGSFGWQEYALSDGRGVRKVDPSLAPISTALGVLGMPGLTAYFGLLEVGRPKPGETVLVSGAAGAVGSCAGQIAKLKGCRVLGVAGGIEKTTHLTAELGFDAALDYRETDDYTNALRQLCPRGIDVYFDNVGGAITDAAMRLINTYARISICGQISQYNLPRPEPGPRPYPQLLTRQARAEGFLVFQFSARYADALRELSGWLREGKLKYRETIANGIENAPAAFLSMLRGGNIGKQLVKLSEF